jgi:putative endonuclease
MEHEQKSESKNIVTGQQGELLCAQHYANIGFVVLDLNYRKKWGEIDVIAKKDNKIHFIEVKTVSYETKTKLAYAVTHGTWRPEDNVHQFKLQKLARAIETWVIEHRWSGDIQIDVAAVRIVPRETYALIDIIENVIINDAT